MLQRHGRFSLVHAPIFEPAPLCGRLIALVGAWDYRAGWLLERQALSEVCTINSEKATHHRLQLLIRQSRAGV